MHINKCLINQTQSKEPIWYTTISKSIHIKWREEKKKSERNTSSHRIISIFFFHFHVRLVYYLVVCIWYSFFFLLYIFDFYLSFVWSLGKAIKNYRCGYLSVWYCVAPFWTSFEPHSYLSYDQRLSMNEHRTRWMRQRETERERILDRCLDAVALLLLLLVVFTTMNGCFGLSLSFSIFLTVIHYNQRLMYMMK